MTLAESGGVLAAVLLVGSESEVDAVVAEALVSGALDWRVGVEAVTCGVDVTGVLLGCAALVGAMLDEACEALALLAVLTDELDVALDDAWLVVGTIDDVAASELACELDDEAIACGVEVEAAVLLLD